MRHYSIYVLFAVILFLHLSSARAQQHTLRSEQPKNRIAVELLGDPFSLNLERRLFSSQNYNLYGGVGVSLLLTVLEQPNVSLSLNNCYKLSPKVSLFCLLRSQLVSLAFPQVPLAASPATSGYVQGRNHLGVNTLSFNMGIGASFHTGKWEFSPIYPSYGYSLGSFVGEDVHVEWYHSLSLNSRIYYHF